MNFTNRVLFLALWWCLALIAIIVFMVALWRLCRTIRILCSKNGKAAVLDAGCQMNERPKTWIDDLQGLCDRDVVDVFVYLMLSKELQDPLLMGQILLGIKHYNEAIDAKQAV